MMKLFSCIFLLLPIFTKAQLTHFEKSGGTETATYAQIIGWYQMLAKKSPMVKIKPMGTTDAGYPLHLVTICNQGTLDPLPWHKQNKIIILINNGIHPGEPDGIDGSMMLARDLIQKKITLPNNVALAIIPVYNIGGCLNRNSFTRVNQNGPKEYGFRGNAQNLDLNRDFTKADTKNAQTFAEIFHYLQPDLLLDNHVSDGADFQHTLTLITTQYNKLGSVLGPWLKQHFEPQIYKAMQQKKWDLIPYVDFANTDIRQGMTMFYDPPRYSSGYAALFHTPGFMPETHMLKPYKERVQATYELMQVFIKTASLNALALINKRKEQLKAVLAQNLFTLSWKPDSKVFDSIIFKGYQKDTTQSQATGLPKMFYNHQKPFTLSIPFYNNYLPQIQVLAPKAYIIPQGWYHVINRLKQNKVTMQPLQKDTDITVTYYKISHYQSYPTAYEKHHKNYATEVTAHTGVQQFLKGDYYLNVQQAAKRYIIEMLEPIGDDSFFSWNFFDGILQQKEGYSDYRWEELAAQWLKKDPNLQKALQQKKAQDSSFANNSGAILKYIYKNSPYYEKAHLTYPVYRVENK